MEQVASDMK